MQIRGVVVIVGLGLLATSAPGRVAHAKSSPELKCRNGISVAATGVVNASLKALETCHKLRDKGQVSGDCNELDGNATVQQALTAAAAKIGALCQDGNLALRDYPGGNVAGVIGTLLPALREQIEDSGDALQGAPDLGGDPSLAKCHGAIGLARRLIVGEIVKLSAKCQKKVDKSATEFSAIAPQCIASPGKARNKAAKKLGKACSGVDGAQVGSCSGLPDCVYAGSTETGQLLARLSFGGPTVCGNGLREVGEDCDDGNQDPTDGCTAACKVASCGDGTVQAGVEECDDGNFSETDACTNQCKNAFCGDGLVNEGVEECDDAAPPAGVVCAGCEIVPAICGADGIVTATVAIDYSTSQIPTVALLNAVLDYPDFVAIPGAGDTTDVTAVTDLTGLAPLAVDEPQFGKPVPPTSLRVAYLAFGSTVPPGPLYTARLSGCPPGTPIRPRDFSCLVEEAGGELGEPLDLTAFSCSVTQLTAGATP
jgi:cysteine-rich repeat protein